MRTIATARRLLMLAGFVAASLTIVELSAAEPAKAPAWELWPYRVQVFTAVESSDRFPGEFEEELPALLASRVPAIAGGSWIVEVKPAPVELRHLIVHEMSSIEEGAIPAAARKFDKVILLGISASDRGFLVRAREFDVVTGLWNATVSHDVQQSAHLPHEAVRAVFAAFAPLARIEKVEGDTVTLRLRASALAPRDWPVALARGTVFRPVLVDSDAKGVVTPGKTEAIDWTYLVPTETSGPLVKCRLHTGLSGQAIPDYHPQRQRWAIGISPSSSVTRLRLVSRGGDAQPLEGCDVLAEDVSPTGKSSPPVAIGQSDRRGEVLVTAGEQTVRIVQVRHADEVLARLPVVPGLAQELTLPLSLDFKWLELKSALSQLSDELIDAAARREVYWARIRAAEQAGKNQDAAKLREQFRELPGVDSLLTRLDKLQQSAQSASAATKRRLEPELARLRKEIEQLRAPPPAVK